MGFDNTTFQLLQSALLAANMRQQVYANNIANAQTPGYKRQDVQFESVLNQTMSAPLPVMGERSIPIPSSSSLNWMNLTNVKPQIVTDNQSVVQNNGNNVDIDAEMADLAENQIRYNTLIQDVQDRLTQLRTAINGG